MFGPYLPVIQYFVLSMNLVVHSYPCVCRFIARENLERVEKSFFAFENADSSRRQK